MLLAWKKRCLASLSQWSAWDLCDRRDEPGVKTDDPALVDYSNITATVDQQRIEMVLAERDLSKARLLHVGVGDSGLAQRFHERCHSIDGITVSDNELRHANSRNLANYRVFRVNKYARDFTATLQSGYQVIVDNNPASFACCSFHFAGLLDSYRWALAPGGILLTDQRGLHWVAGDRRFRMTFNDLAAAGARFGLTASRVTEFVYSLRRD